MGELTDKTKGIANQVAGKTKQAVGDAADRPDIRAEGPPVSDDAQPPVQQPQQKKGKKESGIRRLLRTIFGGNGP